MHYIHMHDPGCDPLSYLKELFLGEDRPAMAVTHPTEPYVGVSPQ